MWIYNNTDLYHHGIEGMKWGVRRYQNPDGTLTAEGRLRYYKDAKETYKMMKKPIYIGDDVVYRTPKADILEAKKDYKTAKASYKNAKRAEKGEELLNKGKSVKNERKKAVAAATLALAAIGGTLLVTHKIKANKMASMLKAKDDWKSMNFNFHRQWDSFMRPNGEFMYPFSNKAKDFENAKRTVDNVYKVFTDKSKDFHRVKDISKRVNKDVIKGVGAVTTGYLVKKRKNAQAMKTAKAAKN